MISIHSAVPVLFGLILHRSPTGVQVWSMFQPKLLLLRKSPSIRYFLNGGLSLSLDRLLARIRAPCAEGKLGGGVGPVNVS